MSTGSILFMALSWAFVLGLAGFSYARVLRNPRPPGSREDSDGAP